jgi:hypothetical protein
VSWILDSPPRLAALVLCLLLISGLGWTVGPRQYALLFLGMGFLVLFAGGTATIIVPRLRAGARLASERASKLPPPATRAGLLRRLGWWNLTWTIASPLALEDVCMRIGAVVEARKASNGWPFGDSSTKLHIDAGAFTTAPGWLWRAPFKPVVSGWGERTSSGAIYVLKLGMAYDPPFEVLFTVGASIIAVGWIAAFVQQGLGSNWQFLPLAFLPLAIVFGLGQIGRWRLRRAAARLVADAAVAVGGQVGTAWPGWS